MKFKQCVLAGLASILLATPIGMNFASGEAASVTEEVYEERSVDSGSIHLRALSVTEEVYEERYVISGIIHAEALGVEGYNDLWFTDSGQEWKTVVEAVYQDGVAVGAVDPDGSFRIELQKGTYEIRVSVPGHISQSVVMEVYGDQEIDFTPLIAGDINGDQMITLQDLQTAAKSFGKGIPWQNWISSVVDLNRDGAIDMLDISFILKNFGLGQDN